MSLTPYDWNQSIQTRMEYIEERLRGGSPVVGLSIPEGVLLLSVHRAQRKVYEIYDRLIFGAIGHQSDIEAMRNASIDFAHREGFQRSPDDVTAQRLVGSVLSPALKQAYGDPFTAPLVFRGLFAELGERQEQDLFYALGFDGEFKRETGYSVVAGSLEGENRMIDLLHSNVEQATDRPAALRLALEAWATGKLHAGASRRTLTRRDEEEETQAARSIHDVLKEELSDGTVEAGLLERNTPRESKFRLLRTEELQAVVSEYQ
jgi:proteasome alpha subunit